MVTQVPETKIVDVLRISCDGGEGALGHPRVWLQISVGLNAPTVMQGWSIRISRTYYSRFLFLNGGGFIVH